MAAEVLASLSDALASAVETAGPSIVRVEGRRRLPASGIVWSADGLFVTAHHVVEQDENIGIGLSDGRTVTASLVGRDPTTDLALLRAPVQGLTAPQWAAGEALHVGHLALALGRPGQSVMATLGIVSALKKDWRTPGGGQLDYYLQTDALMYPGFSGGPLVDATGKFIGLNTSAMLRDVTLTIPAGTIRRVAEALQAHGRVKRGYLGVGAQTVRLPKAVAEQTGQETGLLLGSVEANSPAERSGLFMGDTLLSLAGQPTKHLDDLLALLSGDRVGQTVPVRVLRGGQVTEVNVVVGEKEWGRGHDAHAERRGRERYRRRLPEPRAGAQRQARRGRRDNLASTRPDRDQRARGRPRAVEGRAGRRPHL
jgi:S1-C subfamily serine protease